MPKSSDEFPQRWPHLGKFDIAILENLVEKTIDQSAIDDVKKPYAEKQMADSVGEARSRVEADFIQHYDDTDARDALLQLPAHDLPDAAVAIWAFSQRPNGRGFADLLTTELNRVHGSSWGRVDADLRDKINALANLEAADSLRAILAVLSIRERMPVAPPAEAAPCSPVPICPSPATHSPPAAWPTWSSSKKRCSASILCRL